MVNFAQLKTLIVQCDLETKTKTFKAIDLQVKTILTFDLHFIAFKFSLYTTFLQHGKIEIF